MCGVAGILSTAPGAKAARADIAAMTARLAHRGPDDAGMVLLDPGARAPHFFQTLAAPAPFDVAPVALGHRRLSILDLSERGRQPLADTEGRAWMVFNGEVYNYVELRAELESFGHRFSSTGDSEVVLKSYLQWGVRCFERFNGMWALGIYDVRARKLVLSRDRFGKKPLYFARTQHFFLFASEIKALLTHGEVQARMNLRKVAAYAGRHYRYVNRDETSFFDGVESVPKSSFLEVGADGTGRVQSYWRLAPSSVLLGNEEDLTERYKNLLDDAVRIRLRSDVPVGVLLSGGLDSTAITALAARRSGDLRAFSGITGTGAYDEGEYIREVVRTTGVQSILVRPEPGPLLDTLREMLAFHDEPVCTATWYSLYLITREVARHGIKVVMTGHGGDELLAGYWDHYHYHFHDLRAAGKDDGPERAAWLARHRRDPAEYDRERVFIDALVRDRTREPEKFSKYMTALSPALREAGALTPEAETRFPEELTRRLFLELFRETVPASLRAEDRNMMAFSIENRVPFLDYRLAEFCFALPNALKIRGGLGKWIHRQAMTGVLPEAVRLRPDKTGHNVPVGEWFRGELKETLRAMIEETTPVNTDLYARPALADYFHRHLAGEDHAMFFWQYLNIRLWHEQMFSQPNKQKDV